MKDVDSAIYLLGAILCADGLNDREKDHIKQNIFQRLEKAHIHIELSAAKIAIYLKNIIPHTLTDICEIYEKNSQKEDFVIPEEIKKNCIKHIKNLTNHVQKRDLEALIEESIKVDGKISKQEHILKKFLIDEIEKHF